MSRLPLQQFRFKGTPLFGVDSSPHFTSKILGIAGTVFFWLIFLLCMCLIRFKEKEPEFKEVKIILSSTPLQEVEVDTAPALAASAAQSAESAETQASAEAASQPAEQIAVEQPASAKPVESRPHSKSLRLSRSLPHRQKQKLFKKNQKQQRSLLFLRLAI